MAGCAGLPRDLPIVTTPHAAELRRQGFRAPRPLATWGSAGFARAGMRLRVTAMPGRHAPGVLSAVVPPVMGSMLEFQRSDGEVWRLYATGDTLLHGAMSEIPRRYPDIDLALMHLGGTRIGGILLTMDDRQGVEGLRMIRPARAAGIHYDDYPVFRSPLEDFLDGAASARLRTEMIRMPRGSTYRVSWGQSAR